VLGDGVQSSFLGLDGVDGEEVALGRLALDVREGKFVPDRARAESWPWSAQHTIPFLHAPLSKARCDNTTCDSGTADHA
jgi:hypothetical protein